MKLYLAVGGQSSTLERAVVRAPPMGYLCSFVYYESMKFDSFVSLPGVRDWILDSGAYTAFHQGKPIELQKYIDFCKVVMSNPIPPSEIYALDVIDDWRQSVKNTEEMWRQGVPAIPCYHAGEPEDLLISLARDYPKIALSSTSGNKSSTFKLRFFKQCLRRIWPKKVHAFGLSNEKVVMALPFHSVDSTNWQINPLRYGIWKCYDAKGGPRKNHDLLPEIKHYVDLEDRLRVRWAKEMKELEELDAN